MKVALVHYWLVGMRGGEKVLEALCELYPDADIYTHVVDREKISEIIKRHKIFTTFISSLPRAKYWYQRYLPFMPLALEQLDLSDYDLVISSESGPAKGVITSPEALHICYCHSPMRYVWDMYPEYQRNSGWFTRMLMVPLIHYLKLWDFASASRVDHFIANSEYVARRIRKFYRREAEVIHPPVAVDDFYVGESSQGFYLMLGQLVGYKKTDIAVRAFNELGLPLIIIGEGEQYEYLKKIAGPTVTLLGWQPFAEIKSRLASCHALIFPGVEDFGIVPLEAMSAGKPVIAYAKGGALETVKENETGVFFHEQTPQSLVDAVKRFESMEAFDQDVLVNWARSFSREQFKSQISTAIARQQAMD